MVDFSDLRKKTACFSGHRPHRLAWGFDEDDSRHSELIKRLDNAITVAVAAGVTRFLCGGALGVDTWAAEAVFRAKQEMGGVTLEVVIPFLGQEKRWAEEDKERYKNILLASDGFIVLEPRYTPFCMMNRNKYLTENSSRLIAVYDGNQTGGTWHTIKMAIEQGLELDVINPNYL
ncbi:MAG: DUF1273 domain-containing protein [Oscillospiraceae bacterium]|nr:DUF1273 domain-containing protein [Oscillospiraceae bacterium]